LTALSSAAVTAIFVQLLIVLLVVRRSYNMARGVRYSSARLAVIPVLILLLWIVTELEATALTPWAIPYLLAADAAILVLTTIVFIPVAERMTHVTREPSGGGTYRIAFSLAALFVAVFLVRLVLAIVLFPASLEFGPIGGGYPPLEQQIVIAVIDALLSVSVGLLVARSVGIRRKWEASRVPDAGGPLSSA
jgi:hypothetical protein